MYKIPVEQPSKVQKQQITFRGELSNQRGEDSTCRAGQMSRASYRGLNINSSEHLSVLFHPQRLCSTDCLYLIISYSAAVSAALSSFSLLHFCQAFYLKRHHSVPFRVNSLSLGLLLFPVHSAPCTPPAEQKSLNSRSAIPSSHAPPSLSLPSPLPPSPRHYDISRPVPSTTCKHLFARFTFIRL